MSPQSMSQMFQQAYSTPPSRSSNSVPQPTGQSRLPLNRTISDDDWGDRGQHKYTDRSAIEGWRYLIYGGGLGKFIFSTSIGWELFVGVLVLWLLGCGIGLAIVSRTILWSRYLKGNYTAHTMLLYMVSGVYEFPYPVTTTYIQLVFTHFWIALSAYATRWKRPLFESAGLAGMVAPSSPLPDGGTNQAKKELRENSRGFSGIAGGGFFEFDRSMAKKILPLAMLFTIKTLLSAISSSYTQYPVYVLAQIGLVPFSLFFTYRLGTNHHLAIVLSALAATCALGASIYRPNIQYPLASIVAGAFASLFAALYPIQISRTYQSLIATLILQGDSFNTKNPSTTESPGSKERARAFWLLLHYTSLLSILCSTPVVILSGELPSLWRNYQYLDGFFYWFMVVCGSLAGSAVLYGTIALTTLTSPLTATFLFIPEASVLEAMMIGKRLPVRSWIALSWCWVGCGIFLLKRWEEGRRWERFR